MLFYIQPELGNVKCMAGGVLLLTTYPAYECMHALLHGNRSAGIPFQQKKLAS
jgi:hypothetical protein